MLKKRLNAWLVFFVMAVPQAIPAENRGHWELGLHYSWWTLNLARPLIEDQLGDVLEDNLKDRFLEEIQKDFPDAYVLSYSQELKFDSGGNNYGFEVRWYPGGEKRSFSLGLSIERTEMEVSLPELTATMKVGSPTVKKTMDFSGVVNSARFNVNPISYHLSLRWDIKPAWRLHPYITFGLGIFFLSELKKGRMYAAYGGDLTIPEESQTKHYEDVIDKTVQEALDEAEEEGEEIKLPPVLPVVQLNVGLKGEINSMMHLLVDFGFWDGFLLRGGLSIRF